MVRLLSSNDFPSRFLTIVAERRNIVSLGQPTLMLVAGQVRKSKESDSKMSLCTRPLVLCVLVFGLQQFCVANSTVTRYGQP